MSGYLALALSVGVLAIADTWLFVGPVGAESIIQGLVWVSFIAWGCFYQSGGGMKGLTTTVACMIWGAIVGMGAVMLASNVLNAAMGTEIGVSVAVGLGAFVICLSSKVPLLSTIPASVYGFASIAGPIVLRGDAPEAAVMPVAAAIIIGALFGYVSEVVANAMTKKSAE